MKAATTSKRSIHTGQLKTIVHDMGEKLTAEKKRPWHLEMAISFAIAGLGAAVLLASAQVI